MMDAIDLRNNLALFTQIYSLNPVLSPAKVIQYKHNNAMGSDDSMRRHITAYYAVVQSFYWMTYTLMFNFTSLYLLDCGYTNSAIGVILGLCYALAAVMQPLLAALFSRSRIRLNAGMAICYAIIIALSLGVYTVGKKSLLLNILFVAVLTLQASLQPSVNSLQRDFELAGQPVNFGLARGIGSAAYSIVTFAAGQLLRIVSPRLIPMMYFTTSAAMIVLLIFFRAPVHDLADGRRQERASVLKQSPAFALYCAGLIGLSTTHMFINHFCLQIFHSLGGGSGEQGIAMAVAAIVELPAMIFYARLSAKFSCRRLTLFAGWVWLLKGLVTFIAPNSFMVCAASVLQMISYAIYVPAGVQLAGDLLPAHYLRGQAMIGTAFTLGSLLSSLTGGALIDAIGVHAALGVMQIPAVIGAVLWTASMARVKAETK